MSTSSQTLNIRLSLATILIAGLFIAGCGQGDDAADEERPPPPQAGEEVTVGPESETEGDAEPDEDATGEVSTEPVGEFSTDLYESEDWPAFGETYGIYPTEVRSAVQDGFERIVIQHSGSGTPRWATSPLITLTWDFCGPATAISRHAMHGMHDSGPGLVPAFQPFLES